MKNNYEVLNNVNIDLDEYQDINIDKDKLKQQMRQQIKSKGKLKKNISVVASACIVASGLIYLGNSNPALAYNIPI